MKIKCKKILIIGYEKVKKSLEIYKKMGKGRKRKKWEIKWKLKKVKQKEKRIKNKI